MAKFITLHPNALRVAARFLFGFCLTCLLLLPMLSVIKISLSKATIAMPPYEAAFLWFGWWPQFNLTVANFHEIMISSVYWSVLLFSLRVAFVSTVLTLLIGYPLAYSLTRLPDNWQRPCLAITIIPFWVSFLVRIYAWISILKDQGFLNIFLLHLGIINEPLQILNSELAIYIGVVYCYLPFMVLPIYSNLDRVDLSLLEAAEDLGCSERQAFWKVVFPSSLPGVLVGCLLVFIPVLGEFAIPDLLGGSGDLMLGNLVWTIFFTNLDWPMAATIVLVTILVLTPLILLFKRLGEANGQK